ncbi:MAG: 30S ribosomal protein S4 [Alphaproteobacteria bacterium]|nr:30S ribosomal protein S4 [Alphaproteobacteria bacterium]
MTKRVTAKYKISRRLGASLWGDAKDPFNKRAYAPGQHGAAKRKKTSDYGTQLREKQKLKGYYANITERQFRKIYTEALRRRGDTGENLIGLLETRLDTVVYRMGLVQSMFAARQFVNHGHVRINGNKANIPSMNVSEGDVIEVREKSKQLTKVLEMIQNPERSVPEYISFDKDALKATFVRVPKLAEVPYATIMQPNAVIEFYSR